MACPSYFCLLIYVLTALREILSKSSVFGILNCLMWSLFTRHLTLIHWWRKWQNLRVWCLFTRHLTLIHWWRKWQNLRVWSLFTRHLTLIYWWRKWKNLRRSCSVERQHSTPYNRIVNIIVYRQYPSLHFEH